MKYCQIAYSAKSALLVAILSPYITSALSLFAKLHIILNVCDICQLQIGVFMYKYVNSAVQLLLSDYLRYIYDCHNHNTGSTLTVHILRSKQVLHSFSIVNTGPRLWNLLSYNLQGHLPY